jgi:hypothetical protein
MICAPGSDGGAINDFSSSAGGNPSNVARYRSPNRSNVVGARNVG